MTATEHEQGTRQDADEFAADCLEAAWAADQAAGDLAASLPEGSPEVGETAESQRSWQIGGDREAQWAIDRMAEHRAEVDRIRANAQAQIDAIQAKAERDERAAAHHAAFFEGKLIAYRLRLEAENPRLPATYKLANGDLCRRAGRKSTKVVDEPAFTEWALDHDRSAVTVKPRVSALSDLPRASDGTVVDPASGEPIPGVVTVQGDPTYSVKPETHREPF